ncbi:hypothetical protein ACFXDH_39435 [Streptomyces sp. NPDC059467]|uniref:hypothetical protein n=1 Tax=Streptomyces sp. NPDC059467 TaxID=3346844 RepID=UPI0036BB646F
MDSQGRQTCPVCGQPVESVVRRHKTLGAWVPVWGPGPCRNTDCAEYTGPSRGQERRSPAPPGADAHNPGPRAGPTP